MQAGDGEPGVWDVREGAGGEAGEDGAGAGEGGGRERSAAGPLSLSHGPHGHQL